MKEFDLNIEKILENWEVYHAVREIIANAIDEQILTNTHDIEIIKKDMDWHIIDYGRGLNYHHLTQNENEEKLNNDKLIGRFGVGLKDALATFYRHNIKVSITSKYGIITLKQSLKAGFDDIITLHAKIEPPIDENMAGTDFCLSGCSDEDIEKAKSLFMKFNNCTILETTSKGQVISKNSEFSDIYINGVKVAEEDNFLFSYNITSINTALKKALNRERTNVGRSAYTNTIKAILLKCSNENVINLLVKDLQLFGSGKKHDELLWNDVSLYASKKLAEINKKTTFVTTEDLEKDPSLIDEMKREGYNPIVVSSSVSKKMEKYNDEVEEDKKLSTSNQFVKNVNKTFEPKIIDINNLTASEMLIFNQKEDILDLIGGKPRQVNKIQIAETLYTSDYRNDTVGLWDSRNRRILIKRSELKDLVSFAGTLLHECAHATSNAPDVNRNFELKLTEYLGILAKKELSNNYTENSEHVTINQQSKFIETEEDNSINSNNDDLDSKLANFKKKLRWL